MSRPIGRRYQEELANNPEGNQSEGPEALRPLQEYDPAQGDALEVGGARVTATNRAGACCWLAGLPFRRRGQCQMMSPGGGGRLTAVHGCHCVPFLQTIFAWLHSRIPHTRGAAAEENSSASSSSSRGQTKGGRKAVRKRKHAAAQVE